MPMVEAGAVFADAGNRKQVEGITFYSTSYEFSLKGEASDAFKAKYMAKYNKEPNFGAAFGYDILNIIDSCKDKGVTATKDIRTCLRSIPQNKGIAGTANQLLPGDFTVKLHLEKVN